MQHTKWLLTQCRIRTLLVLLRGAVWGISYREKPGKTTLSQKNSRFQWRHCNFLKSFISSHTTAWPFFLFMLFIKRCYQITVLGSKFVNFFLLLLVRLLPPHLSLLGSPSLSFGPALVTRCARIMESISKTDHISFFVFFWITALCQSDRRDEGHTAWTQGSELQRSHMNQQHIS